MREIFDRFLNVAMTKSDKQAIWCDGVSCTYGELKSLVCRYANYLIVHEVKRGEIIGIPMNNSIESVALIFAAASLGVGIAPINPTLPVKSVEVAFKAAHVSHVIARKAFFSAVGADWIDKFHGCKLCLDSNVDGTDSFDEVLNSPDDIPYASGVTGDEPLIITLTSGSTGDPKPIVLTQNNKIIRADTHINLYEITENDRVLAATPLYHSLAERLVIMPLILGGTCILLPRFTPLLWLNCVRDQLVTFTIAVSAQLAQIAQLISSPYAPEIESLRCIVSSSSLLESHIKKELVNKLECDFHEMYGTSECSTVTDINIKEANSKRSSVGKPLPGVKIKIVDEEGNERRIGEVGEIVVDTPLRCKEYFKMPDIMNKSLINGYFRTGDLGKLDDDGYLYFSGRKKEIIITGGVNVYPKDIENKVIELEGVKECAAFAYADERLGEIVALAVVLDSTMRLSKKRIQLFCARNLADFQQPHKIFILDELPKNTMGKIIKMKLPEVVAGMEG